ncbi:UDP-glucosyltransferase 2-like isoform X1 [Periplaneta americana]|uniref:UDP-glucosyltransferase 2-like isoform X1 n=1 Tax=Periplaneta americana TaxID=6978 RepID=UPI0037E7EBFD
MWTEVLLLATLQFMSTGLQGAESARILSLLNAASPSHYIFNRALILALANRGHQVTLVSPDAGKDNVPNLKNIKLEGIYDKLRDGFDFESFGDASNMAMIATMFEWMDIVCRMKFQSDGAKKLLNYPSNDQFDLIIAEVGWAECFYGFIHKFGSPPVVAISPFGFTPWITAPLGAPDNPSYMPVFFLPYTSSMTFTQKIYNTFIHYYYLYKYQYEYIPNMEAIAEEFIKMDMPSFVDIQRNVSIFLANTVFGLEDARPLTPNMIPIGGMHIKEKPDPLPKDLQKYLDEAKEGFIYFSLGSNLRSDTLTLRKRQALLDAFAELPQRILWKFESENIPGIPPNVKISKWLPQSDILAHPNIRMFITHCGKMSTSEATYRGVPIVGVPFFVDQMSNMQKIIRKGMGVYLDHHTMTKESVLIAIREILNNASYEANSKKMSELFRDHPTSALDRAVFWTEYVIRHQGAPHLRSAGAELYWYEYLLLDVLLVVVAAGLAIILVVYWVLRVLLNMLFSNPTKKMKQN